MTDNNHIEENTMTDNQTIEDTVTEVDDKRTDDQQTEDTGNREAAKYRRRLRDTEAERDQLAQRVESMQRTEVERLAAVALLKEPRALWAAGTELADLLAEDGTVDPEKVTAAIKHTREHLGIAAPVGNYVPRAGGTPQNPIRRNGIDGMLNTVMGR